LGAERCIAGYSTGATRFVCLMLPGGAQQPENLPPFRDRNRRDFAPSWPEQAQCSRSGLLLALGSPPYAQAVLTSKKTSRGKAQAIATGQIPRTPHPPPSLQRPPQAPWPPTRKASYPASAISFRASMSLTTMRFSLSSIAPPPSSLRKARVTATRLQPIIEASRSWV
jgi:hypothetical protein